MVIVYKKFYLQGVFTCVLRSMQSRGNESSDVADYMVTNMIITITNEIKMIQTGKKIDTSFSLEILEGSEQKKVTFADLLDKPVIVSVYMKNNTSGCDRQNQSLAEKASEIAEKGYNIIAISKDSCRSHKNYAEKLGISYILASDPDHEFARATDSLIDKKMYGKTFSGPSRSAYFIDTDGTVQAVIEKIDTTNHADELLEKINDLNS